MNLTRIYAVFLRYFLVSIRNLNRPFLIIYWSILNIVLWGTTSIWIQQNSENNNLLFTILCGVIFWQIVFRVNLETSKCLFQEITERNLINLFSSPLKLHEWIIAVMALGFLDAIIMISCGFLFSAIFFKLNILKLGLIIIPSTISLIISGWTIGFLICSFLICYGTKAQDLVYSIGYIFAPFSAIYYPIKLLPYWMKSIALCLPTTYVFENIRSVITTGNFSLKLCMISLALNIFYLLIVLKIFYFMIKKSKIKGLARIE